MVQFTAEREPAEAHHRMGIATPHPGITPVLGRISRSDPLQCSRSVAMSGRRATTGVMRSANAGVFALLERWRDDIAQTPVTLQFDIAALRARERANEKRRAVLEHRLGLTRDVSQVVSRVVDLAAMLAPDDVRDSTSPTPAWLPDELWPYPAGAVGSSQVSTSDQKLEKMPRTRTRAVRRSA